MAQPKADNALITAHNTVKQKFTWKETQEVFFSQQYYRPHLAKV
jgi:hypothetical protein